MFEDRQEGKDTLSRGVLGRDVAVPNVCPSCLTTNFSPCQHTGSRYTKAEMVHLEHALSSVGLPNHFFWSTQELRVSFLPFLRGRLPQTLRSPKFYRTSSTFTFFDRGCRVDLKNKHVHCQTPTLFSQLFFNVLCVCPVLWVPETKHCDKIFKQPQHMSQKFTVRFQGNRPTHKQKHNNTTTQQTRQNKTTFM